MRKGSRQFLKMSSRELEMKANGSGRDVTRKKKSGGSLPIEVVVHGGDPSVRRSRSSSSTTELPKGDDGAAPRDDRPLSEEEGEQRMKSASELAFMDEFRLAIKDHQRLKSLFTQADNQPENAWTKALLWASASGHAEFISTFLNLAPGVLNSLLQTAKDGDGFTTLHRAVIAGQKEVVKLLASHFNIAESASFNILHARTPEGWTCLHLAVVTGDDEMVKLLIDAYGLVVAPPYCEWDFADNLWMTPLHYAVLGRLQAVIQLFMKWPAYDRHVNARDYYMRTPLHMASSHEEASIKALIQNRKVDINAVDCCSFTPLHWAVYVGATETVRCLLSLAGERTIRTTEEDIEGRPVFQVAVENSRIDQKVAKDIEKLLLTSSEVKDEIDRLYRDRQVYVDAANAILVGAALIASVTFGGWLQPPGGIQQSSSGDPQIDDQLRVFWAFNSLSFFFSIATVMAGAAAVLPMEDIYIGRAVRNIRRALALTSFLLIVSVVLVLGAFGASGFAALGTARNLKMNMIVTASIGTGICTLVLIWFLERLYRIRPHWRQQLNEFRKRHQSKITGEQRHDLVEIQKELEEAEMRARAEMEKKYGGCITDRKHVYLTDLVLVLREASEKAVQVRKQPFHQTPHGVLRQKLLYFEEAYQNSRMHGIERGHYCMLILTHLSSSGIHHWVEGGSMHFCRSNCLRKDLERWTNIRNQLLLCKGPAVEDESTRFEYGKLTFKDWSV